ncbi:MAG: integrase core domain-containing protein [Elainellaceae cyanobacterium]
MAKLHRQLRNNRFFRLTSGSLKFFTLFLFGICFVSFVSALTLLQLPGMNQYVDKLMYWGVRSVLGLLVLLAAVATAIAMYEYSKAALKRRRQNKSKAQVEALKTARAQKEAHGELETYYPGYLGAQDTLDVGDIRGLGYVYQQTFIDTYARVAVVKVYDCKTPLVAADLLNDGAVPLFEQYGLRLQRILTDREAQYCGNADHHQYQKYLAIVGIGHAQTKVKSPQANGICEEFHQTMREEFYQVMLDGKVYQSIEELQADIDQWVKYYNWERPHPGRYCYGKTPMQTLIDGVSLVEKAQDERGQDGEPAAPDKPVSVV